MTPLKDVHDKSLTSGLAEKQKLRFTVIAVGTVLTIGIAMYWFFRADTTTIDPRPVETAEVQPEPPAPEPEPVTPTLVELPELDVSDPFVRDLVAALSAHPDLVRWIVSDGLIRRFVVIVDNIAEGKNPSQHMVFMEPSTGFRITSTNGLVTIDPRSYQRYDSHVQMVDSLNTEGTAELYLLLEPLMDEAYVELGYPETPFRNTLERAITQLLETPILETPPAVRRRATFYEYVDGMLEALMPVQKQFIGIGPNNMRTIQTKVRGFSRVIGIFPDQ